MSDRTGDGEPAAGDRAHTESFEYVRDADEDADADQDDDDEPSEEPVAAAPPDPMQEIEFQAAQKAFLEPPRVRDRTWLLLITLALFVGATMLQGDASSVTEIATLVGVILLHELGHAVAMLAFRYTDVRVFFIPFFGAAASGRRYGVARWKQGLVLMMGPLPGLVLGCALLLHGSDGLMHTVAVQLVAINAFNLLPIAPFDGGQLFNLVLFSRHRHVEMAFLTIAALAVIGLALLFKAWIFGVLGLFMLLSLPVRKSVLAAANELRTDNLPEDPRELDEPQRRRVFDVLWKIMSAPWRGKPAQQAATMEQVHASASQRPLSVDASVAIGALWIAGAVLTAISVSTVLDARTIDAPPPPAQWQRYYNVARTFSLELPAQPIEATEPEVHLAATWGNRQYGVMWAAIPPAAMAEWKTSAVERAAAKGSRLRDLELGDGDRAFVIKQADGLYVTMRIAGREGTGFIVIGTAYIDDPAGERVVRSFRIEQ